MSDKMSEVDWENDEQVVRTVLKNLAASRWDANGLFCIEIWSDIVHVLIPSKTDEVLAWKQTRQHPTVVAFERENRPVSEVEAAKKAVLAKWPNATVMSSMTGEKSIWTANDLETAKPLNISVVPERAHIAFFLTENCAWLDAASKLTPAAVAGFAVKVAHTPWDNAAARESEANPVGEREGEFDKWWHENRSTLHGGSDSYDDSEEAWNAALAYKPSASARDWTEDASHENGNYFCNCVSCGQKFIGHKRRVQCKLCASKPSLETQADDAAEVEAIIRSKINMTNASPVDWIGETLAVMESRKQSVVSLEIAQTYGSSCCNSMTADHHPNCPDNGPSAEGIPERPEATVWIGGNLSCRLHEVYSYCDKVEAIISAKDAELRVLFGKCTELLTERRQIEMRAEVAEAERDEAKKFMSRVLPVDLTVDGYTGDLADCVELYNHTCTQLRAYVEMLDVSEAELSELKLSSARIEEETLRKAWEAVTKEREENHFAHLVGASHRKAWAYANGIHDAEMAILALIPTSPESQKEGE